MKKKNIIIKRLSQLLEWSINLSIDIAKSSRSKYFLDTFCTKDIELALVKELGMGYLWNQSKLEGYEYYKNRTVKDAWARLYYQYYIFILNDNQKKEKFTEYEYYLFDKIKTTEEISYIRIGYGITWITTIIALFISIVSPYIIDIIIKGVLWIKDII